MGVDEGQHLRVCPESAASRAVGGRSAVPLPLGERPVAVAATWYAVPVVLVGMVGLQHLPMVVQIRLPHLALKMFDLGIRARGRVVRP